MTEKIVSQTYNQVWTYKYRVILKDRCLKAYRDSNK